MPASVVFTAGRGFCLSIGVSEIEKTKNRQSHQISAKVLILNAPPMGDVHTKNQLPVSKNGLVRAGLRLKSVKNAVFRPFLKKCRKGDVIRSQRNLGLPGFKCRRRFSEILGPFGWITASHGLGSPQKVPIFGWSEPVWSRYQPKTSQTLRKPSPICESG